ncbi:MAG TPA: ABATE domain-containing protein [Trebonia sp.]|nr:ABATE domain-containing protein [Trebonia sp.]
MTVPDRSATPAGRPSAAEALTIITSLADTARPGADPLATREDAAGWLRAAGLFPAGADATLSGSEHGALLRLRDSLRDVLAARAERRPDDEAAARLTRALADGRLVVTIDPDGSAWLASSARAVYSNLVAAIAIAVAGALG